MTDTSHDPAPRVLIIEDDFLLALEMEITLLDAGFDVIGHAVNQRTALNEIAERMPDVALVDFNLADGATGPDIAFTLSRRGVACLFVTSQNPSFTEQSPAIGLLSKPIDPDGLIEAVRCVLSLHHGQTPARTPHGLRLLR